MKKLSVVLGVIICFTMLFGLTACNNEDISVELDTAYEKIEELTDKIDELNQQIADLSESLSEDSGLPKYNVQFVSTGSTVESITASSILYSPTTIKDNYNFVGWFYDTEATRRVQFPLSVNSNMILYAKFKETRESLSDRFYDYIHSLPDKKLIIDYPILDSEYITMVGDLICLTANWENTTGDEQCTVTETIYINLMFNYGKLDESGGTLNYSIVKSGTATNYSYYYEYRDIISVNKIGSFYDLNSRTFSTTFNGWDNLNTDLIDNEIKTYFDYAIGDVYHQLFQSGFEDTIFFYN